MPESAVILSHEEYNALLSRIEKLERMSKYAHWPERMKASQAAEMVSIDPSTIFRAGKEGRLTRHPSSSGNGVRYDKQEVLNLFIKREE